MAGPPRVPLIGIYLLTSYPEIILPLSVTKGNFVRLHSALADIRAFLTDSLEQQQSKELESCVGQGVLEACKQYKRYVGGISQAVANFSQLELIIFTGHPGNEVQRQMATLAAQIDLSILKRIVSATVRYSLITPADAASASPDSPMLNAVCDDFSGLVDLVTLDCDQMSLQRFFYFWLTDTSSDSEYMHLLLPPPSPADPPLVIKCDLAERMISPTQLPQGDAYDLHGESSICRHIFATPSNAMGIMIPIHQLKVVCCLPREALCESVLFGMPLIALPTACWKMEWEVLEKNQHHFVSLCNELLQTDRVLLTQLERNSSEEHGNKVRGWSSGATEAASSPQTPKPSGYFVLLPSEQRTLLVKNILPRELLLPSPHTLSANISTEESNLRIQASLSQVETVDHFSPLSYVSGLVAALKHNSLPKSAVDKARANKRKAKQLCDKPIGSPASKPRVAGGRLAASHCTNPLAEYVKTRSKQRSAEPDRHQVHVNFLYI